MPPLVMTSGNLSDEPIAIENSEALERLAGLADAFLLHDRGIHVSCDDSVVCVFEGRELPFRRSRGYAPFPVSLPVAQPSVLATGGEIKATLCLTRDSHAFMSQHIGDMANLETLAAFDAARAHLQRLFRIAPRVVACDRHPGYLSTSWAREHATREQLPLVQVQHHHAHIAAVMAEHRLDGDAPVLGVCFDGTGYGDDGAIWGGEVLIADYRGFHRVAHLAYVPQPGGDLAVQRPYRMALAHLWSAGIAWDEDLAPVAACPELERRVLAQQLRANLNCAPTSSMGRLFDAVAALIGVQQHAAYEAQAAIEMEALADAAADADADAVVGFAVDAAWRIDPAPVLRMLIARKRAGASVAALSGAFHNAVADLVLDLCVRIGAAEHVRTVALSGGVFQNRLLLSMCVRRLNAHAFTVLTHTRVPPNDGGLALGQAVIAGHTQ
jgi:hydrogenase maturation protein HypF